MIVTETYTLNNVNPNIREAVTLYSDRSPTEEELFYINMHSFDGAYRYANSRGWKVARRNGVSQAVQNPNSRSVPNRQTGKNTANSGSNFSATEAVLGGSICVILAIVALPVILLNDGSVIFALLVAMGLSYLGTWLFKQAPKEYQDKVAAEQQRKAEERLRNGYKCPNCGRPAGHPIGVINKGVSIGTLGLASNKVGKTYKCENCGYMW